MAPDERNELREGYAEIGDIRVHYIEAGEGPLIVLLHGFPEFWFGWRLQIRLAAAGFRVVAPDMRGYNLSSRPAGVATYDVDRLAADVRGLIRERGAELALLVGHDWGATVAWETAMSHPEVPDRLVILNVPHPRRLFFFFQLSGLPERFVRARHWWYFRHFLRDARPAFTPEDLERYVEAWAQPGAAAAMINYYRAALRQSPKRADALLRPVLAPTLVIWRQRDRSPGPELAEPDRVDVPRLDRVVPLPDASHWVHHDKPERVTELLFDFFAPTLSTQKRHTSTA
jgi:pimeloyl-ACP methyl ester carboxylesterase